MNHDNVPRACVRGQFTTLPGPYTPAPYARSPHAAPHHAVTLCSSTTTNETRNHTTYTLYSKNTTTSYDAYKT